MYCPVCERCKQYPEKCLDCCASLDTESAALSSELPLLYKPLLMSDAAHPLLALRKAQYQETKRKERSRKASTTYRQRSGMVKRAYKEEQNTREAVIRATKRSGALDGDGDSRLGNGAWGIDDKYHSTAAKTITVAVSAVDKASQQRCVVVVTLATGRKFVVADLDDFCSAAETLANAVKNTT